MRSLLILVLPVLMMQLIAVTIFYDRHWASVTRQLSSTLAGEVAWVVEHWEFLQEPAEKKKLLRLAKRHFGMQVDALPPMRSGIPAVSETIDFPEFDEQLRQRIRRPFALSYNPQQEWLNLQVPVKNAMLRFVMPKKRLASSTTFIFIAWIVGSSILLLSVAILFLRNQIRPIVRLADAAEQFGRGQPADQFKPSGAMEVRRAARSFIDMQDRIRRQVESRTAMLAGISHDLRTPLTRMKLELEMLSDSQKNQLKELREDLDEMQTLVDSYLAFASGEKYENLQQVNIAQWLGSIVAPYQRRDASVKLGDLPKRSIAIRPEALSRCLRNVIDNALRYGKSCWLSIKLRRKHCIIMIDDDGPGIPEDKRQEVFRAFKRLEGSRNNQTGGAGLGLSIVRDIVHAHGGEVSLDESPYGGLRVVVELPL